MVPCSTPGPLHDGLGRRRLIQASLGFIGVPLCCTTPELRRESFSRRRDALVIDLTKAPELRQVGSAAALVDPPSKVNLIVVHVGRNRFVALDRSCTHNGAQCAYNRGRRTVQCTSLNHAEYDLQGTLLHGRTHGNLLAYGVTRVGGLLEIRLPE